MNSNGGNGPSRPRSEAGSLSGATVANPVKGERDCKNGINCWSKDCPYRHPEGRQLKKIAAVRLEDQAGILYLTTKPFGDAVYHSLLWVLLHLLALYTDIAQD